MAEENISPNKAIVLEAQSPTIAELSEALYRDIAFADAKAGFSMTISALGIVAAASFFGAMPDAQHRVIALTSVADLVPLGFGVIFAIVSMICAAMTVLPRRYIQGLHFPAINADTPLQSDIEQVLIDSSPLIQRLHDGAVNWFELILQHLEENNQQGARSAWLKEVGRQIEVRRRKYWWVGAAVLTAIISVLFFVAGIVIAVILINQA